MKNALSLAPTVSSQARNWHLLIVPMAFAILWWMQDLPPAHATYLIGIVSLLAVGGALGVKYAGRWQLNGETVLLGGITLQYLVAPTLHRWLTTDYTEYVDTISFERAELKQGYAGGMLVVLCFVGVFLIVSHSIRPKDLPKTRDGSLQVSFPAISVWVVMALIAVLWLDRFLLLKTGSYYHLNRSTFQEDDWRYSIMSQVDTLLSNLVVTYLFARCLVGSRAWLLPGLIYLGIDAAWNFGSGSRERVLMLLVCLAATYVVVKRRIPLRTLGPTIVGVLFLIGFMDYYRYAVTESETNQLELSRMQQAVLTANDQSDTRGWKHTMIHGLARINDLESIAAIHWWVPDVVDFLQGETYWSMLAVFVPRFLWTEKPAISTPINKWFFTGEGGSSPLTTMGEGYLNFGWAGVVFAGICGALLLRWGENFLLRYGLSFFFVPVYISFLMLVFRIHTQALAIWLGSILKLCLLLGMFEGLRSLTRLKALRGYSGRHVTARLRALPQTG